MDYQTPSLRDGRREPRSRLLIELCRLGPWDGNCLRGARSPFRLRPRRSRRRRRAGSRCIRNSAGTDRGGQETVRGQLRLLPRSQRQRDGRRAKLAESPPAQRTRLLALSRTESQARPCRLSAARIVPRKSPASLHSSFLFRPGAPARRPPGPERSSTPQNVPHATRPARRPF